MMSRAPWYAKTYKNNNFIDMLNRNKRLICVSTVVQNRVVQFRNREYMMIGNPKRYRVVREQLLQIRLHAPHGVLDHAHVHLVNKSVKNFLFLEIRKDF